MQKLTALILGGSGQDGTFLAREYLKKGFSVFSISKSESLRIRDLGVKQYQRDFLSRIDISDVLLETNPDIVVNLASVSSVATCEVNPNLSRKINVEVVINLARQIEFYADSNSKDIKFLQASSSEMYGSSNAVCDESTPMSPLTVYGKHKHEAHRFILSRDNKKVTYKSVILFNHESEFRPPGFVSYKVSKAAAEVALYGSTSIKFGNILNRRDWGFAGDYMEALVRISLNASHESYVIASGKLYSIEEMLRCAFKYVGLSDIEDHILVSEEYYRTIETPAIVGNAERCVSELNWNPTLNFESLVERLVESQLQIIRGGKNASDL